MENKTTSLELKIALMSYYRFKRQCVCATECLHMDFVAITTKGIVEVETKVNKYDLWKGEAIKNKHNQYKQGGKFSWTPNCFYICVTEDLQEEAIKWVEQVNPNYGVLVYLPNNIKWEDKIWTVKSAQKLHNKMDNDRIRRSIAMRCSCENITLMQSKLPKKPIERNSFIADWKEYIFEYLGGS